MLKKCLISLEVASKRGYNPLRITGNEPTIGKDHLFGILEFVDQGDFRFILETNGILIGQNSNHAEQLSKFKNLHVRVSLKATDPQDFSRLTGAAPEAFSLQLEALKNACMPPWKHQQKRRLLRSKKHPLINKLFLKKNCFFLSHEFI